MKIIAIECNAEEIKANRGFMDAIVEACSGLLNSFYGTHTPGAAEEPEEGESEEENNE